MPDSRLLQAINGLWIIDPDTLAQLREAAQHATEFQAAELMNLVKDIEKSQAEVLKKMIESDPQFPQKLSEFLRQSLRATQGEVEATDVAGLSNVESQIEQS